MSKQRTAFLRSVIACILVCAGCDSSNERVVQVATQAADRQAQQNDQMARLQADVSEGARQLVAAEAEARREWVALKHDVQQTMAEVGKQRDALEAERRAMALQRERDPVVAKAIEQLGWVVLIVVPLIIGGYAYVSIRQRTEILRAEILHQLLTEHPALLDTPDFKPQLERRDSESHSDDQDGSP